MNGKDLIDQASLKAMNVPTGQNDLQSANNKKGFKNTKYIPGIAQEATNNKTKTNFFKFILFIK